MFQKIIRKADTYHFTTISAIEFLSLIYDSVVPNRNSEIDCNHVTGIQVSGNGSVACKQLDNTKLWSMNSYFANQFVSYLVHDDIEAIFDIHEVQDMNNLK